MNKVYKVVWNVTLGTWTAVSELARGCSKTKSKNMKSVILPLVVGLTFSSGAGAASYNAGGGNAATTNSIAIGTSANTASSVTGANQSVAIGYSTTASGDQSVALGANVIASGNSAIAIGGDDIDRIANDKAVNDSYEALTGVRLVAGNATGGSYRATTASGAGATAMGTQSAASGNFSTALGMTSTASGNASSALGVYANASGGGALAIGAISKAEAEQSISLGTNSKVVQAASNSIAIGNGAVANNKDSIAIGSGSNANSQTLSNQAYLVGGTAKGEMNIGDRRITGVSAGSSDTDAVNVSQLKKAATIAKTTVSKGKNIELTTTQNADGSTNYEVATADNLNVTSVTAGNTTLNNNGLAIDGGPSVLASGIDAGNKKVTNVANGDIDASSKDAVNGSQLFKTDNKAQAALDTANKGFALKAQDGRTVQKALGEAVEVVGADTNIETQVTNGQIQIRLSDDINVANSITAGGNTLNAQGLTVGDSTLTSNGLTIANGGPSVLATGIDAGDKKITNVANGAVTSTSKDAVNGSLLYGAQSNVANVIGGNTVVDANGNISTSNIGGTGKNTISEAVAAAKTTVSKGKNMEVTATQNTDGSTNYEVATAENLDVTSLKAGNTVINNNGLSIVGGPSVLASGIDAGNKKISSVANGAVTSTSKDAVNGSQLYGAQSNVANVIGGNTVVDANGNISTSNIGGTGKNTISEAVAAAKTTVSKGKNMEVTATQNTDGSTNYEVATAENLDVTSLKAGNTVINNNGLSIVGGPSVLATGIDAGDKKITNVANGAVNATSSDAINGSQLFALKDQLDSTIINALDAAKPQISLSSNGNAKSTIMDQDTIDIGTAATERNLTAQKVGNSITFALNPDLDINSVTAGGTLLNQNGLSFVGQDANGNPIATGPSIGLNGIDAGDKKITNVANGAVSSASKDAVNGSQLYNAQSNVANVIGGNTTIDPNTGNISTSNIGGTGKSTISEAVAAAKTTVSKGKNMEVTATQNTDGSTNYEVATADNLDVTSLKAGNTLINNTGLTIAGGPSVLVSGIDAGNKKISNVANGAVSSASKDAVNGSQLYNAQNNVANIIGGNTTIDPNTGNLSTSNIGGTGKNTIDEAVAAAKTKVSQGKNMVVTETKNADGSSDYKVATADNLDVTSLKAGNSVLNNQGLSITGGPSILVSGINAGNKKITNVANGSVSATSTDAVNGSQLYTLDSRLDSIINKNINALEQGFSLSSNGTNTAAVVAGDTLDIGTASTEQNLTVTKSGNTIDFALNPDLTVDSVNAGGTIINGTGLSFQTLDENGGIIIAGPSISYAGINAGNTVITSVADGEVSSASKDAVNGSQLYNAQNNVANIIGGNTTINPNTGNITASDIGGTGANNIHDAIQSVNNAAANANQGWNVSTNGGTASNVKPGNTVDFANTDGNVNISNNGNNITVNLNKDQNLGANGSLTTGDTKVTDNGLTIAGGPSVTKNGIDAGDSKVTNVSAGTIASGSKDAVNGGQIHDMMGVGAYDPAGNLSNIGGTGESNINDAIAAVNKNAVQSKSTVSEGSNIKVVSNSNTDGSTNYTVSTADDITLNSVTAKQVNADKVVAGNTTIDTNGLSIKDGPSITSSGINAGNKVVSGVAKGDISASSTQAVNGSQLNTTNQYIANSLGGGAGYNNITQSFDAPNYQVNGGSYNNVGDALGALNDADQVLGDRITNLGDQLQQAFHDNNQRINDVEKRANAGIAAAMALETAPYIPGKYTYAAGAAYHGGENAVGVTLRKTADNGRWSLTGGIASASQGDPSVRIGISGVID